MDRAEIINWFKQKASENAVIEVNDVMFEALTQDIAMELVSLLKSRNFIKLPLAEIRFFEWLKENDKAVWNDLWGEVDEEPYVVGLSFLPSVLDKNTGFPICDLLTVDNYYFTKTHIAHKEAEMLIESLKERYLNKQPLTVAQLLLLQISYSPTDIWHFAYNRNIPLETAKRAVSTLVEDKSLIHFKRADHLANFIEF